VKRAVYSLCEREIRLMGRRRCRRDFHKLAVGGLKFGKITSCRDGILIGTSAYNLSYAEVRADGHNVCLGYN